MALPSSISNVITGENSVYDRSTQGIRSKHKFYNMKIGEIKQSSSVKRFSNLPSYCGERSSMFRDSSYTFVNISIDYICNGLAGEYLKLML
jgi:hypothetical protein